MPIASNSGGIAALNPRLMAVIPLGIQSLSAVVLVGVRDLCPPLAQPFEKPHRQHNDNQCRQNRNQSTDVSVQNTNNTSRAQQANHQDKTRRHCVWFARIRHIRLLLFLLRASRARIGTAPILNVDQTRPLFMRTHKISLVTRPCHQQENGGRTHAGSHCLPRDHV